MSELMTARQRDFARHALGFPNNRNESYRNYFCLGSEGDGYADWEDLVAKGLAVKRKTALCGGMNYFHLTLEGALMVRESKEHLSQEDTAMMRALAGEREPESGR